ncbi:MAG: VOC family protein [Parvularculaceae bacterium]
MALPLTNRRIEQVAYVVKDVRAAAAAWTEALGVGPFHLMERPAIEDPIYRGAPGPVDFTVAVAPAGDVHVELIEQHCERPSCYRDLPLRDGKRFHHVAVIVEDFDAEVARYEALGFAVAMSGRFGPLRFCYVDVSSVTDGMVEILEDKPFIRNYFAAIRASGENWDGSRPLRDVQELTG